MFVCINLLAQSESSKSHFSEVYFGWSSEFSGLSFTGGPVPDRQLSSRTFRRRMTMVISIELFAFLQVFCRLCPTSHPLPSRKIGRFVSWGEEVGWLDTWTQVCFLFRPNFPTPPRPRTFLSNHPSSPSPSPGPGFCGASREDQVWDEGKLKTNVRR